MTETLESLVRTAREKKDFGRIDGAIDAAVAAKKPDSRALCLAILRTRLDAVEALLAAGTSSLEDKVDGLFSPLQLAAVCKWYWPWLDPAEETSRTVCPQILAAVFDKAEYGLPGDTASEGTVEMLGAACASRHEMDEDEWRLVLGNAATSEIDPAEKIALLLRSKPPHAAIDEAATRAAESGRVDILGQLLAAGGAATAKRMPELTVRAARAGAKAVVELLLARGVPLGAKATLTDEEGSSERVVVRDEVAALLPHLAKAPATNKSKKAPGGPSTLDPKHVKTVLSDLNDVAPDTLDGGAYSRWKFTKLERDGNTWTLHYTNSGHPKGDFVRFEFSGDCVAKNRTSKKWEDAAFKALAAENIGDDDF